MRESKLEKYLIEQADRIGGLYRKQTNPGRRGVLDRALYFPHGLLVVVEMKAPGQDLESLQRRETRLLKERGFWVEKIDFFDQVDALMRKVVEEMNRRSKADGSAEVSTGPVQKAKRG